MDANEFPNPTNGVEQEVAEGAEKWVKENKVVGREDAQKAQNGNPFAPLALFAAKNPSPCRFFF